MFKGSWNPFKKEDPKEMVRKWKASIRSEIRSADREQNNLLLEQKKAAVAIKEAAKRNDMASAKLLAREVVRLRGAVARIAANKANMMCLSNEMTQMLAMSRAAGTIKSSSDMMKTMNSLIKVPQMQANMKEMAREMAKAGFIQEMMDDAISSAVDTDGVEEAAEEAVDQVLLEITGETLSAMSAVPSTKVPGMATPAAALAAEEEDDELMERLAGLRAV